LGNVDANVWTNERVYVLGQLKNLTVSSISNVLTAVSGTYFMTYFYAPISTIVSGVL